MPQRALICRHRPTNSSSTSSSRRGRRALRAVMRNTRWLRSAHMVNSPGSSSKRQHLKETAMDEKLLVAALTVGGTLIVSLLGSFMGSRLARRTRWRERISEALPKFYASSTVAWYAWKRYLISKEETPAGSMRITHYYDEHVNSYRDLLSSAATLAMELKGKERQAVWD